MAACWWHCRRNCTFIVQVSWDTAFQVSKFMLRRHLEMAGHSVMTQGGKVLYIHYSGLLGHRALWVSRVNTQNMVLTWLFVGDAGKETAHSLFRSPGMLWVSRVKLRDILKWQASQWWHWGRDYTTAVEVFQDRGPEVSRCIVGRWSWNGHLLVTLGKRLCIYYSGLLGYRTLLVGRVLQRWSWNGQGILGRSLKMIIH